MTQVFAAIASVFSSAPILDKWFERFLAFYLEWQRARGRTALRETLEQVIRDHDQRNIETPSVSGMPSGKEGILKAPPRAP